MPRYEFKYFIPFQMLSDLRKDILPYLNYDKFSLIMPEKEYTVRSIYLDSPRLLTYQEKMDGLRTRHKYRIRGYNTKTNDSLVFMEIKRKDFDFVSKDRAPLLYCDLEKFLRTNDYNLLLQNIGIPKENETSACNFLYYYFIHNLAPSTIITYEREAFECKFNCGLRVTFDKNVRVQPTDSYSNLFSEDKMTRLFKDHFILEIKYGKILPSWLPAVLRKYDLFREAISKYSIGVDVSNNTSFSQYLI